MNQFLVPVLRVLGLLLIWSRLAFATATWTGNSSDLWSDSGNWSPNVPTNGDDAIFGASAQTAVEVNTQVALNSLTFNSGTPGYSFMIDFLLSFNLNGAGIINNSSTTQMIANTGGVFNGGGGSLINFHNSATAGNITLVSVGGSSPNSNGGNIIFWDTSTAGNATIVNNGADISANGGNVVFIISSNAGSATITTNGGGGDSPGAGGGLTVFQDDTHASSSTLITNGSQVTGSSGGVTSFRDAADGDTARAITNLGGLFEIDLLTTAGMNIGSIEGAGTYSISGKTLHTGGNNLSTTVSGSIQGAGGSLHKVGTGTLILSGSNNYTGATTVSTGTLALASTGSLGNTAVTVSSPATFINDGSLGGSLTLGGTASGQGVFGSTVTVLNGGTFSARGTVKGTLMVNSGALVALTSGTLTAAGGVVNNGTMRFSHGASLVVSNGFGFTNNGTLDVISGSFSAPAGFTNNGTLLDASVVRVKNLTKGSTSVTVLIDSYTGHTYQLQRSSVPNSASFSNVPGVATQAGVTGTTLSFTDPSPPSGHSFYRIGVDP